MPVIVSCLLIFIVWLRYEVRKSNAIQNDQEEQFWEKEQASNHARKKAVPESDYIVVPYELLVPKESVDPEISSFENYLKKLSKKKILNLSGKSNTDLKLTYGPSSLASLSEADENYTMLVRTLNQLGTLYLTHEEGSQAQSMFEYAIEINSDISTTYSQLATLYEKQGNQEGLAHIVQKADTLDTPNKAYLLKQLKGYRNLS